MAASSACRMAWYARVGGFRLGTLLLPTRHWEPHMTLRKEVEHARSRQSSECNLEHNTGPDT